MFMKLTPEHKDTKQKNDKNTVGEHRKREIHVVLTEKTRACIEWRIKTMYQSVSS